MYKSVCCRTDEVYSQIQFSSFLTMISVDFVDSCRIQYLLQPHMAYVRDDVVSWRRSFRAQCLSTFGISLPCQVHWNENKSYLLNQNSSRTRNNSLDRCKRFITIFENMIPIFFVSLVDMNVFTPVSFYVDKLRNTAKEHLFIIVVWNSFACGDQLFMWTFFQQNLLQDYTFTEHFKLLTTNKITS